MDHQTRKKTTAALEQRLRSANLACCLKQQREHISVSKLSRQMGRSCAAAVSGTPVRAMAQEETCDAGVTIPRGVVQRAERVLVSGACARAVPEQGARPFTSLRGISW